NDNNITENILKDNNLCISELYCQGNLIINNDCTTPTVQEPIFINGTATGFGAHNWTWVEQQSWFGGGLGTENVPYIIENLKITGYGIDLINGIEIVNSNVFFIIRGCIIYNSVNGISLKNVNNSQLINNTCSYNIEAGIYLEENSYFNNISENILNDNDYGIYLVNNCGNNTITENKLNSMIFDGIYLDNNCNYTTITGNTLNNNEKGIYLTSCGYNNITGNTATDNTYNGIHLESFNDYNIIIGNNFDGNDIGIELNEESDFNIVIENTVNNNEGGIGIIIENCIENDISGNSANNNSYGIYIYENSNNNSISGNTANDNSVEGIYLYGYCINNSISGNTLNNNYRGIRIHSNSEFNNVSGNTINYNDYGIFLSTYTNNNTISNNKMNCKNKGIELDNGCQDNTISGNIIRNCTEEGVILKEGCDNNEFVDNIIYNNSLGIDVSDSDDNWFYRNFFVNNIKHAVDDGSDNMWNSTTIGNYWDNLTGPDANSDGIVDSEYRPYNISGSAQSKDYFPIADDEFPTITINTPTSGNIFGSMAPSFNVRITDVYLYEMWYTINGGLNNYTFTDNGTINQDAWDAIAEGNVTLTFYASDKPMHTNSEEIVIVKDNENPSIYINSPSSGEVFDNNAPFFNVRITEDYLVSMWYTIDGGLNNYTFTTNSTINQTRWDAMTDGTITLRFYAIDDLGHVGTAEVSIIKDTIAPIIIINAPTDGETFGNTAPLFNITIIEANLDEIWYSIDGGLTNYTILNNGTFDQTAWTALSEGEVNITFYVKDLAGHEVSESVAVIKSIPDGGLDPTIIIIIVVSIVVGVAVISVVYIFVKKRGST
ncbi:MAG: nitrous oxide reductase family maturation protein NosD, partial [Promethearchaeota archaeon]